MPTNITSFPISGIIPDETIISDTFDAVAGIKNGRWVQVPGETFPVWGAAEAAASAATAAEDADRAEAAANLADVDADRAEAAAAAAAGSAGAVTNFKAALDTTEPLRGYGIVVGDLTYDSVDIGPGSVILGGDIQFPNNLPGRQRLRAIIGGYDSTIDGASGGDNSGLACGIVVSHHSSITGLATHGFIAGGSYLTISTGDYSVLIGGQLNAVQGGTDYATIFGGGSHVINLPSGQDYAAIIGGYDHDILTAGRFGIIAGGSNHDLSGPYAASIGGQTHIVSGSYSGSFAGDILTVGGRGAVALGGSQNTLSGTSVNSDYAVAAGGFQNNLGTVTSGRFGGMLGGRANSVQGEMAATVGGRECTASGEAAVAMGYGSVATAPGSLSRASGYFSAAGDAQALDVVMRRQTTDATPTELRLGSTLGTRLVLTNDSTYAFSALVVGRATGAEEGAAYELKGCIHVTSAGSTYLIGSVTKTVLGESVAAWDATAAADATNKALQISVTGEAAKTINWVADVKLVRVTG